MASRRSNKRKQRDRGRFGALYKIFSLIIILVVKPTGLFGEKSTDKV